MPSPVLLLEPPPAALLLGQEVLTSLPAFDRILARLKRRFGGNAPNGLVSAWNKCEKMVRRNKCTAVC